MAAHSKKRQSQAELSDQDTKMGETISAYGGCLGLPWRQGQIVMGADQSTKDAVNQPCCLQVGSTVVRQVARDKPVSLALLA